MGDSMTVSRSIREHLPAPLARTAGAVRRRLRGLRYSYAQLPAFPPVPTTPVRMLVGPTNSAGQGYAWAPAGPDRCPGSAPSRSRCTARGSSGSPTTTAYRSRGSASRAGSAPRSSTSWAPTPTSWWSRCGRSSVRAASRTRPPTSRRCAEAGVNVGLLFHGSDIRLPSRHAKRERWSPFTPGDDLTERLESQARRHAELVASLGLPVFVSTVDLLDDVPDAQWLPVAIDPTPWQQAARPLFAGERPVVVHVPSNAQLKGTDRIDEVLTEPARPRPGRVPADHRRTARRRCRP